jgi:hypothetical protein
MVILLKAVVQKQQSGRDHCAMVAMVMVESASHKLSVPTSSKVSYQYTGFVYG